MKVKIFAHAKNWFSQVRAEIELEADTVEDMKELFDLSKQFEFKVKM